jgi:hypothetical protein
MCDRSVVFSGYFAFLVSSTNKTDCHDIAEILLNVVLNTSNQPINDQISSISYSFWVIGKLDYSKAEALVDLSWL